MKKISILFTIILTSLAVISCATFKEIPQDKTAAQIIQYGQNAVTDNNYKTALYYYEEAINRFGTNPSVYAEAKYEIGHVYIKQHKYENAYKTFKELISLYDYNAGILPAKHKKLAEIGISQIPEKKLHEIEAKLAKEAAKNTSEAE